MYIYTRTSEEPPFKDTLRIVPFGGQPIKGQACLSPPFKDYPFRYHVPLRIDMYIYNFKG